MHKGSRDKKRKIIKSASKELQHVDVAYLIKIKIYYKTSQAKNLLNCTEHLKTNYDL